MFYEEKWIGEKLFWRGLPDGEWIEFTIGDYKRKVKQLEQQVKSVDLADVGERKPTYNDGLRKELERLKEKRNAALSSSAIRHWEVQINRVKKKLYG